MDGLESMGDAVVIRAGTPRIYASRSRLPDCREQAIPNDDAVTTALETELPSAAYFNLFSPRSASQKGYFCAPAEAEAPMRNFPATQPSLFVLGVLTFARELSGLRPEIPSAKF
jgi:hypothetical protein